MKSTIIILLLSVFVPVAAFVTPAPRTTNPSTISLAAQQTRTEFLRDAIGIATIASAVGILPQSAFADETTASGVAIKVVKSGNGPKPTIGELASIRFAAYNGEIKIDDIFETPEPYFTRVGSGGLIKGVEEVLPMMRVGDRWVLTIPVSTGDDAMSPFHFRFVYLMLLNANIGRSFDRV
jgi:hypothetical protein